MASFPTPIAFGTGIRGGESGGVGACIYSGPGSSTAYDSTAGAVPMVSFKGGCKVGGLEFVEAVFVALEDTDGLFGCWAWLFILGDFFGD